jgi:DNA-binding NarL/FixJ family response regulator
MVLDRQPWVAGVEEAGDGDTAIKLAVTGNFALVVMDVRLPDADGIEVAAKILRSCPNTAVAVVSQVDDADTVVRALRIGARGYVLKTTEYSVLTCILQVVASGGTALDPTINPKALTEMARVPPPFDALTQRELEIVGWVASGANNSIIGHHLGLNEKTIRNKLSDIFRKTGVDGRTNLALLAKQHGIDEPT